MSFWKNEDILRHENPEPEDSAPYEAVYDRLQASGKICPGCDCTKSPTEAYCAACASQ